MPNRIKNRRFSVSLTIDDYDELVAIAKKRRIPLPLQTVVNAAIQKVLDQKRAGRPIEGIDKPLGEKTNDRARK